MREQRGESVDAEAALQAEALKPGLRPRADLANRLKLRKERQRQGLPVYSGFVPPYNTQSRVFDANELRRAANQVWRAGKGWGGAAVVSAVGLETAGLVPGLHLLAVDPGCSSHNSTEVAPLCLCYCLLEILGSQLLAHTSYVRIKQQFRQCNV